MRLAVLTGGGDVPGLNSCIRAIERLLWDRALAGTGPLATKAPDQLFLSMFAGARPCSGTAGQS